MGAHLLFKTPVRRKQGWQASVALVAAAKNAYSYPIFTLFSSLST